MKVSRLLYLSNLRIPTEKAYGIQIVKMCEAFALNGLSVELVAPTRKDTATSLFEYYGIRNNFKITRLYSPDFYFSGQLDKFAFLIKNFISALRLFLYCLLRKQDIVFSRDELPLYFLSFFKSNLVFEAHKFSSNRPHIYRRFKSANVKIVAISSGLKDEFVKFGFSPSQIIVAHDGVDVDEFNIQESVEECRRKLSLPLDKKIIGYVGQLRTMGMEKGIAELIDATSILKKDHLDILLAIVGGTVEDINYYKELASQKGIDHEIVFLGRKSHKEIPYFLRAFDILTMPFPYNYHYAHYMSPLKLFEYMASGKPIVASDLPTIREILNDNNSVMVKPEDIREMIWGINKIISDQVFTKRISETVLLDVKMYTWSRRAEIIINFAL